MNCLKKVELIDFHQTVEVNGVKFTPYYAGHVLGACMFLLDFEGTTVLYTGDYSYEEDRHLMMAELPPFHPDVLIVESTFGTQTFGDREGRESRFTSAVARIVRQGGRCLVPVFALGRAQELLLILDELWQNRPDLQQVPIYFASKTATKALRVYQTYVNMMNQHIKSMMDIHNPFHFQYIRQVRDALVFTLPPLNLAFILTLCVFMCL